jgi:hypothetical protein
MWNRVLVGKSTALSIGGFSSTILAQILISVSLPWLNQPQPEASQAQDDPQRTSVTFSATRT